MIIFLKCHNIQRGFLVYVKFLNYCLASLPIQLCSYSIHVTFNGFTRFQSLTWDLSETLLNQNFTKKMFQTGSTQILPEQINTLKERRTIKITIFIVLFFVGKDWENRGGGYFTYHVNLIFLDTFRINSKY